MDLAKAVSSVTPFTPLLTRAVVMMMKEEAPAGLNKQLCKAAGINIASLQP